MIFLRIGKNFKRIGCNFENIISSKNLKMKPKNIVSSLFSSPSFRNLYYRNKNRISGELKPQLTFLFLNQNDIFRIKLFFKDWLNMLFDIILVSYIKNLFIY